MMLRTRRAVAAAIAVSSVAAGVFVALPDANAAVATYTCSGATNDVAAVQTIFFQTTNYTSAQLLASLASAIPNFSATPQLPVSITAAVPLQIPSNGAASASFTFNASLPDSLVDAAAGFGLSSIPITNANFAVNTIGATPATISGGFATKTVALAPKPVVVSHTIGGSVTPTGGADSAILYRAGAAKLSIVLNVRADILFADIKTVTLNCTPNDITLGATTVTGTGGSTTTTTAGATTTTLPATTTTTVPPTTTTTVPPTTTTMPATTTTTSTTTTTVPPTTTTIPATTTTTTTTTTVPPTTTTTLPSTTTTVPTGPSGDSVSVTVGGDYAYSNSGTVAGPGFAIRSDAGGVTSLGGFGTLGGTKGGTASISVDLNRFFFWTFGSLAVNDTGAGIVNLQAPIFFGTVPAKVNNNASVSAGWFAFTSSGLKTYTISATFRDGGANA